MVKQLAVKGLSQGGRTPLSAERIVDAAIRMMDREGMAALSMRRLGAELSVQAMSLYSYFPTKEALLAAASGALVGKIGNRDEAAGDPLERLRTVMRNTYRLGEEHPAFIGLLLAGPGAPLMDRKEADIAGLEAIGFARQEAEHALRTLVAFVIGSLHQVQPQARSKSNFAETFEYGLQVILDGLKLKAREFKQ